MRDNVILLAGVEHPSAEPWVPFAPEALDFLDALSVAVRASSKRREELAAFAFWWFPAKKKFLQFRWHTLKS